ncbi:hypothetical protein GPECTOR_636g744 [Gonium pectorale]|uniref:Uncharacterized protein n=1 Tax=Gonium pectorale TaxID=33097 RepID=A0A150FUD4_GONPE|nr:hypothetical protein GPECTOR_636g744 [Gonium pectorale]|eukprot:KXZ41224.1 hypothetical protein GPECTOR_636g744 [Gonium pectorale]
MAPLSASKPLYQPTSARDAIEVGTRVFNEDKDVDEAIRLYRLGLAMNPNEDEARAALYNLGCALAKQKKWAEAADSIVIAINDYRLKLAVALKDDDLKQLRERREWIDALGKVKGGVSGSAKVNLRAEAKGGVWATVQEPAAAVGSGQLLEGGHGVGTTSSEVIPVIFETGAPEVDPDEKLRALRREFAKEGKGFGEGGARKAPDTKKPSAPVGLVEADKKWRLEPYDVDEWKAWVLEQKEFAGLPSAEPNCWIQVQLDGTVRSSAPGTPPWRQMVEDLPLLNDIRTRLMDGVGPQE